jgi:hypothetical protein
VLFVQLWLAFLVGLSNKCSYINFKLTAKLFVIRCTSIAKLTFVPSAVPPPRISGLFPRGPFPNPRAANPTVCLQVPCGAFSNV